MFFWDLEGGVGERREQGEEWGEWGVLGALPILVQDKREGERVGGSLVGQEGWWRGDRGALVWTARFAQ